MATMHCCTHGVCLCWPSTCAQRDKQNPHQHLYLKKITASRLRSLHTVPHEQVMHERVHYALWIRRSASTVGPVNPSHICIHITATPSMLSLMPCTMIGGTVGSKDSTVPTPPAQAVATLSPSHLCCKLYMWPLAHTFATVGL